MKLQVRVAGDGWEGGLGAGLEVSGMMRGWVGWMDGFGI